MWYLNGYWFQPWMLTIRSCFGDGMRWHILPRYAVYNSSQLQLVHINCQKMTVHYSVPAQIDLVASHHWHKFTRLEEACRWLIHRTVALRQPFCVASCVLAHALIDGPKLWSIHLKACPMPAILDVNSRALFFKHGAPKLPCIDHISSILFRSLFIN